MNLVRGRVGAKRDPASAQAGEARPDGAHPDGTEDAAVLGRRLKAALDGIGEGIVITDEDGQIVFSNSAAAGLLSGRPSDALAAQAVTEVISEARAGGRPRRQLELISPHRRTLSIRGFPAEGPDGAGGAVAVVEDISERLRLEAVRRDFVANVSHELKTPTGALTLLAETLDGERDPEVVARLVRRMGGEAERLSRIIDDLLDLSRIEANEAPSPVRVPVAEVVTEAVGLVWAAAAGADVQIDVRPVPPDLATAGDKRDLISAVSNLVDNAVKYSEPGGVVRVEVSSAPGWLTIAVSDEGVGIPSRDMERIFERFYRVDRARSRSTGGTGLGLSIVRHVAVNHGGTVTARSVEGEGSTFELTLPVSGTPFTPSTPSEVPPDRGADDGRRD